MIISRISYSQIDYPRIEIDSLGRKVVVMTIDQAQKIDNNFEILSLLIKQGSECDSLNTSYLKVIDTQGKQVSLLELNIVELKKKINDKDLQIVNLQTQLSNEVMSNSLCDVQKKNKDEEINLLKNEVKKQKRQKVIGFIAGAVGVIGGIILIISSR
jgi:hypothetical protein